MPGQRPRQAPPQSPPRVCRRLPLAALLVVLGPGLAACAAVVVAAPGTVAVVAAENQYGDVAAQVGGAYVTVTSIESNPNTDPHSYEVSPSVAEQIAAAQLLIENGLGYDSFIERLAAASPSASRRVVDVQHLLHLPDDTPNPHLWYSPTTMPRVAAAIATDLALAQPAHAAYFRERAASFSASLQPWLAALQRFRRAHAGTPVATTEPVADDMLDAAGARLLTPFTLQADIMNGVDPAPQDLALQQELLSQRRVDVLVYNEQVTDPLTQSFIADAQHAGIPVVGVYETMPAPGYTYQSWMLAEVTALQRALVAGASTQHL